MSTIIAALDSSPTARDVVRAAAAVAPLFAAGVEAVHVRENGTDTPRGAADTAGLPLRILSGAVVDALAEVSRSPGVRALVIGARRGGAAGWERPAGRTALEVISRSDVPMIVVPPGLPAGYGLRRLLVPLDATHGSAVAVREVIEMACNGAIEVVLLHVFDEASLPRFSDQPQYEAQDWADEFRSRFCPAAAGRVVVEMKTGVPPEEILAAARDLSADLIVLGWAQELTHAAAVVRAALRRSSVPVLLVPAREEASVVSVTAATVRSPR